VVEIGTFLKLVEQDVAQFRVRVVDLSAVQTSDPFRVLIATMLSARTKDEVTAVAAARLFEQAVDAEQLADLSREDIERLIYPVGFYKSKSAHLLETARILIDRYSGVVPKTIDELVKLPGVGRKTANLVLAVAYGIPAICVDTHVHRIMNIWGYVSTKTPVETEFCLRDKLPRQYWLTVNRLLVAFGQSRCKPVAPHCDVCPLDEQCAKIGVVPRKIKKVSV